MICATMKDAKAKLNRLVQSAEAGESVVLMRGTRHVAAIVPISEEDLDLNLPLGDERAGRFWHAAPSRVSAVRHPAPRTAIGLSREEKQSYHPGAPTPPAEDTMRRRKAMAVAQAAATLLREKFGAQRVRVFGSLAEEGRFGAHSDIDMAAWGVAPKQYYTAVAALNTLSSEFSVDLIDPEDCRSSVSAAIQRSGVEL